MLGVTFPSRPAILPAMTAFELSRNPVHLGLGATVRRLEPFDGSMEWYERYGASVAGDGAEGRLVAVHRFDADWPTWEMHPKGEELVWVVEGHMSLVQRIDGEDRITELRAGQAAINPTGVWHTARVHVPTTALFITAGESTENALSPA